VPAAGDADRGIQVLQNPGDTPLKSPGSGRGGILSLTVCYHAVSGSLDGRRYFGPPGSTPQRPFLYL